MSAYKSLHVCVCVCVRVCAWVRVCVCECVRGESFATDLKFSTIKERKMLFATDIKSNFLREQKKYKIGK